MLPKRVANSHKGTYGKTAVFGGSEGMTGSVILASNAVLRAGAGLSYACVKDEIFESVQNRALEVIVKHDKDYKKIFSEVDSLL